MIIRFTIAKRAATPAESDKGRGKIRLQPRLEKRPTVDVVAFQKSKYRVSSSQSAGEMAHALDDAKRVMLHEMEKGNAIRLPGIGTFRLSLKGDVELRDGFYHGKNVHVAGINFQPDHELLEKVKRFKVDQEPYGMAFHVENADVEQRLTALFATQDTITHSDVRYAFELTLTPHRITNLLSRLIREGRLTREGTGCQTRYRAVSGNFGR